MNLFERDYMITIKHSTLHEQHLKCQQIQAELSNKNTLRKVSGLILNIVSKINYGHVM